MIPRVVQEPVTDVFNATLAAFAGGASNNQSGLMSALLQIGII